MCKFLAGILHLIFMGRRSTLVGDFDIDISKNDV